jgi:hypothetical protein
MGAQGSLLCEQMLEDVGFENVQAEDQTMQVTCSQVYLYKRKDTVESKIWVFMKGNIQMIFGSAVYMNMLMPSSSIPYVAVATIATLGSLSCLQVRSCFLMVVW